MKNYFVYIIYSALWKKYYIGITGSLRKRIKQHNAGGNRSTKGGKPWILIVYRKFESMKTARNEEIRLKKLKNNNQFKSIVRGEVPEWSKGTHC